MQMGVDDEDAMIRAMGDEFSDDDQINLQEILADTEGYKCFMAALCKEWMAENLLFLTEVMQFKQHMLRDVLHHARTVYGAACRVQGPDFIANDVAEETSLESSGGYRHRFNVGWLLRLSEDAPVSDMVTDENTRNWHYKARGLFDKFVAQASECEVNIPGPMRRRIKMYFQSKEFYAAMDSEFQSTTSTRPPRVRRRSSLSDISRIETGDGFQLINSRRPQNVHSVDGDEEKETTHQFKSHGVREVEQMLHRLERRMSLLRIFDSAAIEVQTKLLNKDILERFRGYPAYAALEPKLRLKRKSRRRVLGVHDEPQEAHMDIVFRFVCECRQTSACGCRIKLAPLMDAKAGRK